MDIYNRPENNLVEIAMMADFIGFPVTLYLPWGIAAGHVAGPNKYYEHLAERARSGLSDPNLPEGWGEILEDWTQRHFDTFANMKPSERNAKIFHDGFNMTSYLALQDAKSWVGGAASPVEHDYLRVRLTDVTAWAWGAIN